MVDGIAEELLAELATEVESNNFIGHADEFLVDVGRLTHLSFSTDNFFVPPDPFKGDADEAEPDPNMYYRMFWRMFDQTPAAMIQGFAIPLRRILAKKLFRHCGDGVIFHHNVLFSDGANISLGDGVLVNRYAMLDDRGSIDVGAYTMLSAGITIETHTHPFTNFERPIAYAGRGIAPVKIGANSVMGYNAIIMAGTTLGYRTIVGANSVVTKDVPDYTVVGGVPAKPIKEFRPGEDGDPVKEALDSGAGWRDPRLPE
jgi:acetyltransferase-like isoleucine patch superfamily enzyme